MLPRRTLTTAACAVLFVVGLGIRLFTGEYTYRDDPTTGLYVKRTPSFTSWVYLDSTQSNVAFRGKGDEHGYPGRSLYQLLVYFVWPLAGVALLAMAALRLSGGSLPTGVSMRRWLAPGAGVALLLVDIGIVSAMAFRIVAARANHWGADTRLLAVPMVLSVAAGMLPLAVKRRLSPLAIALVAAGALSLVLLWAAVATNTLLPYELWLERGMPARPF